VGYVRGGGRELFWENCFVSADRLNGESLEKDFLFKINVSLKSEEASECG
jgi:hypothetical protein